MVNNLNIFNSYSKFNIYALNAPVFELNSKSSQNLNSIDLSFINYINFIDLP